ncbi:MAG: DNA primase [Deltaproteobacteria bacterium]|nr:DNA primase [Deltaproteobacteria bacterium]
MGWALDNLGENRRREIAASLFKVTQHQAGRGELKGLCPIHGENNPSFSYNYKTDVYNCSSSCGGGDLIKLWGEVNGLDNKAAFKEFPRKFGTGGAASNQRAKSSKRTGKNEEPKKEEPKVIPEADWDRLPALPERWLARLKKERGWSREVMQARDLRLWTSERGQERVAIPVRDDAGRLMNARLYQPGAAEHKIISWGKGYGSARLYPPPREWRPDEPVWLCEGEPDTLRALSAGLNAATQTGGAGTWKPEFTEAFRSRDVILAYDADPQGLDGAARASRALGDVAASVRVIEWPREMLGPGGELPANHGQDLTDWFQRHGHTAAELWALADAAPAIEAEPDPEGDDTEGPGKYWVHGADGRRTFRPNLLARDILDTIDLVTERETRLTYQWVGTHYRVMPHTDLVAEALERLGVYATTARAQDAASQVAHLSTLPEGEVMNHTPAKMCLLNGMLDLDTWEVTPHHPKWRATYQFPVSFDPHHPEDCLRVKRFLRQTVQVPEVIDEMQEFAGYCLWPDCRFEKALILVGSGSDGKSTYLDLLQALVGEDNCSNVDLANLQNEFHRVSLHGKALNVYPEVGAGLVETSVFKAIVSGDRIDAAHKHQDGFMFRPFCKLAFSTNRLPRVQDKSHGFLRKLMIVRFRRRFTGAERDPELRGKLIAELPGFLAWALVGLHRLRKRGYFQESSTTMSETADFQRLTNPLVAFADECLTDKPELGATTTEVLKASVYAAYQAYCKRSGVKPLADNWFWRELREIVSYEDDRKTTGGKRDKWAVGIRLIDEAWDTEAA